MVIFRVLNYEKNQLVYNYIRYPNVFFNTFMLFLIKRSDLIGAHREPGDLLTIIQNYFLKNIKKI